LRVVALDTQVLIWGVQGVAHHPDETIIRRARKLIDDLTAERARIVVPAIALGEFLVKIPDEDRPRVHGIIAESFHIAPFDFAAAQLAAKLKARFLSDSELRQIGSRQVIKADIQIVASAYTSQCAGIYSGDGDIIRIVAQDLFPVWDLPQGEQMTLFE